MSFDEVVPGRAHLSKLDELKASILKETPDAKVFTTIDYNDLLGDMDMIVTSTSGAGKEILDIMKVKPGCVITDVARPLDLPAEDVAKRPDVLVIESGEIELPTKVKGMKSIGCRPTSFMPAWPKPLCWRWKAALKCSRSAAIPSGKRSRKFTNWASSTV
jgi:hypothetical protein